MFIAENSVFYEIDHTADVGIISEGIDLPHTFAAAAFGMRNILFGPLNFQNMITKNLSVPGPDPETLLVSWLTELNFFILHRNFIFSVFQSLRISEHDDGLLLQAEIKGEPCGDYLTKMQTEIKAITYHQLNLQQTANRYKAKVIFDI